MTTTKKIGILGGGQLAMMMAESAIQLGLNDITILDPTVGCPASTVGAKQIVGSFRDEDLILNLAKQVDVLTFDIESVNVDALKKAQEFCKVYPDPSCLEVIQDKWVQNEFLRDLGVPIPSFYNLNNYDCEKCEKVIVKAKTGGYDGKGVWLINGTNDKNINDLIEKCGINNLFVEEFVEIEKELAIIAFRAEGPVYCYPVVETIQENGICKEVLCPIPLDLVVREEIERIAKKIVKKFNTKGVFGIEFFLTTDGRVLVNEVSPRVHNSGHYTIEACNISQFEQHIRCICDLNPYQPELIMYPVKMTNILAKGDGREMKYMKDVKCIFSNIHWYNKPLKEGEFYKKNRKVGHYTSKSNFLGIPSFIHYPLIYIVMGSSSDLPTLQPAIDLLNEYGVPIKVDVVSAHRSPKWMFEFGENVESWCGRVVIAAAGGAAHLPGMLASITNLPVIGVPVPTRFLNGQDSLYSIVEMPDGVPVATVGIGKAKNAAILALRIIGMKDILKNISHANKKKVRDQRATFNKLTM